MTPKGAKIQLLKTQLAHSTRDSNTTKPGLAFSELISGRSPLGRRAEKHTVEMSDRAKSEMVSEGRAP